MLAAFSISTRRVGLGATAHCGPRGPRSRPATAPLTALHALHRSVHAAASRDADAPVASTSDRGCEAVTQRHAAAGRDVTSALTAVATMLLAAAGPAWADASAATTTDFSKGSFAKESYYVTLGLFLLSLPGEWAGWRQRREVGLRVFFCGGSCANSASAAASDVAGPDGRRRISPPPLVHSHAGLWSQIKRAPKSKRVRKVYEVPGPAVPGAMPLDDRARQIFQYFKVRRGGGVRWCDS